MIFFKFLILCIIISYPKISFSAVDNRSGIGHIYCNTELVHYATGASSVLNNIAGAYVTRTSRFGNNETFTCQNTSGIIPNKAILKVDVGDNLKKSDINLGFYKLTDFVDVSIDVKPVRSFMLVSPGQTAPFIKTSIDKGLFAPVGTYDSQNVLLPMPVNSLTVTYKLRQKVLDGVVRIPHDIVLARIFYSFASLSGGEVFSSLPIVVINTSNLLFSFPSTCTINTGTTLLDILDINFGDIDTTLANSNLYDKSITVNFNCTGSIRGSNILKMKITTDKIVDDNSAIATSMSGVSIKAYNNNTLIKPNDVFNVESKSGVGSALLKFSPSLNLALFPNINGLFSSSAVLNFIFD